MVDERIDEILEFWFGSATDDKTIIATMSGIWWGKKENVDLDIRRRFGVLHRLLGSGKLDSWKHPARSRLALIILADQFSRNIYRDSAESFQYDELALQLALEGIASGMDVDLRRVERVFFYMPLEHSELVTMQNKSVEMFIKLAGEVPSEERKAFNGYVDFAVRHQEIIKRFGRFPHRNTILDRLSTEEEIAFLKQPGSSF